MSEQDEVYVYVIEQASFEENKNNASKKRRQRRGFLGEFSSDATTYCKIGMTRDVDLRLAELQTGNPQLLQKVYAIRCPDRDAATELERRFHRRFKKKRVQGEWFSISSYEAIGWIERALDLVELISGIEIFRRGKTSTSFYQSCRVCGEKFLPENGYRDCCSLNCLTFRYPFEFAWRLKVLYPGTVVERIADRAMDEIEKENEKK